MTDITVFGKNLKLDSDGFLIPGEDWNPDVAREIAEHLGIEELDED